VQNSLHKETAALDLSPAAIARSRHEYRQRCVNDRASLISEYTVECPFCHRSLEPVVLERPSPPYEPGEVTLIRRTSCGCEQERAAIAEQEAVQEQQRKDRRREAWAWALARAGLNGWLAKATFDSYNASELAQQQRLAKCQTYCADLLRERLEDKPWLVLYGQYGGGKTHLAAAIIREALGNGWTQCYFRPWLSYLRRLMDSFDEDAQERTADVARELATGRLVAIDDIDNDRANVSKSGFAETELFRAIDDRYRAGLPTILTFNRHPLEMVPWLGAAGVDRVMQCSYALVEFVGTSYRSGLQWEAA